VGAAVQPGIARRLARAPAPDAWVGICVRVVHGDAVAATPDHFLAAVWPPAAPAPSRWPHAVAIGSPTSERALAEVMRHVPADARLYLATPDDVDAALAAEILLASDRNLEPYQREGVAAFVAAERERTRRAIAVRYTDRDAGFERFRATVARPGRVPRP
jgi:hypothetical protein